jgi:predicted ABC-type transport system involved in lysophospholipase L1 biosynthesis ATPase subunit
VKRDSVPGATAVWVDSAEPNCTQDTRGADAWFALPLRINTARSATVLFLTHKVALSKRCDTIIEGIESQSTGD